MPTINLNRKPKKNNYKGENKNKNLIFKTVYNTQRWRDLRIEKLKNNPLCQKCEYDNMITPATQVHHLVEISKGGSDIDNIYHLGFDYDNLMSVCDKCHKEIHNGISFDL
jgi:5-methylcytosine-specific restriction enzyme A